MTAGDADIAAVGALLADRTRARILLALADGRELPASMLASESGVAAATASEHLSRLLDAGLVAVRPQGRFRYYRLAGPQVAELIEVVSRLAPFEPVRSLRQGTRAHALRQARVCYDHLAGRLGVAVFRGLIERGAISGGDGVHRPDDAVRDRFSAPGRDVPYRLTRAGARRLGSFGVELPEGAAGGELPLRYCVDWTEQAHHLAGDVGRALCARLLDLGWVRHGRAGRSLEVADAAALERALGVSL
jgi:DNA-binding transcriptional ArsR family regulator